MECYTESPKHKEGKIPGVYLIEHENGKFYIGSTGNLWQRKQQHLNTLKNNTHNCESLQSDYNQNKNITFSAFTVENREEALNTEQAFLDYHKESDLLYNKSPDARVAFKTMYHSEEAKTKMSLARTGKVLSQEHIDNISKSLQGRKISDETKVKLSISKTGWSPPKNVLNILKEANVKKSVKVIIEGVEFESINSAATYFKVDNRTIDARCKSVTGRFDNWEYKKCFV